MSSGGPVDLFDDSGNNDFLGLIDDFGISGNWGIRADTGNATPTPTPTITPTPTATPPGNTLWFIGDFNDVDGLTNEQDPHSHPVSRTSLTTSTFRMQTDGT